MSRAVILPAPGGFAEIDEDRTVLDRLIAQIREAGCDDVTVLTRPGTDRPVKATQLPSADADADLAHLGEIAFSGDGPLFVACADLVASQTTVAAVLSDSSRRSGVLVGGDDPSAAPVQVERGLVTGPGPGPTRLGGLAKVSAAHLARLERHWPRQTQGDAFDGVLAALHARAVPVNAYRTPGLEHRQAATGDEAREVIAAFEAVDMDAWRLRNAVKHDDDFFATYAVSTWSPKLVKLSARLGWTPTPITWVSITLAVAAAGIFATGWSWWYVAAAALMYFSFVFDCVDGQLARYTQNFSSFGGWLDMMADRSKEFLIYAGLAAGAVAGGTPRPPHGGSPSPPWPPRPSGTPPTPGTPCSSTPPWSARPAGASPRRPRAAPRTSANASAPPPSRSWAPTARSCTGPSGPSSPPSASAGSSSPSPPSPSAPRSRSPRSCAGSSSRSRTRPRAARSGPSRPGPRPCAAPTGPRTATTGRSPASPRAPASAAT
nr:hypothetical protein GCM10025732_14240 [Glycomyces mayteni]